MKKNQLHYSLVLYFGELLNCFDVIFLIYKIEKRGQIILEGYL